jgi:hypothetical protein
MRKSVMPRIMPLSLMAHWGNTLCRWSCGNGSLDSLCGPDAVVIACNTASTLTLPHLRQAPGNPFHRYGARDQTGGERIALGAIPCWRRQHRRAIIRVNWRTLPPIARVTLAGSRVLAPLAEAFMQGKMFRTQPQRGKSRPRS